MDVKILDSWLRDYLQTEAKPDEIAHALSLTSASIENIEPFHDDFIYHVEVTTNRPDMASIAGLAREAAAVLPRFEIPARFISPHPNPSPARGEGKNQIINIQNNPKLVRRICAVILEVEIGQSPDFIKKRLEASGTRSLNNLIDITNYVMHEMGHPAHVFDYDRLLTKKLVIRESKKGEKVITLDKKIHTLQGGDIVADNGMGEIVDLLGVMGTQNSVVTDFTKRIVFFIDNNDPKRIRKTSMSLAIRTEAAGLNEKDVDPELAMPTLLRSIALYQKYAKAKIVSDIIDIYPQKPRTKVLTVSTEKINKIVGITIPVQQSIDILTALGFRVKKLSLELEVTIPSWRTKDIDIEEDIIEEIARVFGYHNIPSKLPSFDIAIPYHIASNSFFWEDRAKDAMKYWGFTETYTYSMVSEKLFGEHISHAVTLDNPLDEEHMYLRQSLLPSLREMIKENSGKEEIKIFEIANVYHKNHKDLPDEIRTIAGIHKGNNVNFYTMKGVVEQLANDLGIQDLRFEDKEQGIGASVFLEKNNLGKIQILTNNLVSFELNFDLLIKHATLKKTFMPIAKFPSIIEDLAFIVNPEVKTGDIIREIKIQSPLILDVSLLDQFENTRTFHIVYQDRNKNLTGDDAAKIREKILKAVAGKFVAKLKN